MARNVDQLQGTFSSPSNPPKQCELCSFKSQDAQSLQEAVYNKIQDTCNLRPNTGCYIYKKKEEKYSRISYNKKQYFFHCLSYHAYKNGHTAGLQIAHLCHRPGCVNPDHLAAEDSFTNNNRKPCGKLKTKKPPTCICGQSPPCFPWVCIM